MKIAVIGSGGREHALLWKLKQNARVNKLFACPGNGGTQAIAESIHASGSGVEQLVAAMSALKPDLVVVGPEQPLADGIVDRLVKKDIPCFGPTAAAARLESSKVFAKRLMRDHGIPTADFEVFKDYEALRKFIQHNPRSRGRVVKADGLAAGKGAFVCASDNDALAASNALLVDGLLGRAGAQVVLEEKLDGAEASAHYWCDGERFAALPIARDYKRALDGDAGPNTGGMGTLCPATHMSSEQAKIVDRDVVAPTLRALAESGHPYRGVLYVGLMLTLSGPQVIEFNCRFGDPETQVMLPVFSGDIAEIMLDCAAGSLKCESIRSEATRAAVCVVLAADGYPGDYRKGIPLCIVDDHECHVTFHAGTRIDEGTLVSSGGRVLNAVGVGSGLAKARAQAYELAERLLVPGLHYRTDIAAGIDLK